MGFVFRLLGMLAIALSLGFGSSYFALTDGRFFAALEIGPWAGWPEVGQPAPDPYTRAYLARTGILQLGYAEGIQFVSTTDSEGEPLERSCHYVVSGTTPTATFWTLVATTLEGENIAASPNLMAIHSDRIARAQDGSAAIHISPRLAPGNWLEVSGTGPYQIALTLYDAAFLAGANATAGAMPAIRRVGCA